jgi:hypothetical protein
MESINLEIATLVSAVLVFLSSCVTLIITTIHGRKNKFIETVTVARKEYLKELRDLVAEFCSLALSEKKGENDEMDRKNEKELMDKCLKIKLFMNPAGYVDWWDGEAVKLIDRILQGTDQETRQENVEDLLALMQSWFALEWHGLMNEGIKGNLTSIEKDELRNKFWEEYEQYIRKEL